MSLIYHYDYEKIHYPSESLIAGFDEAGRGAIAGPIVVVAVILPTNYYSPLIKDSKLLSSLRRQEAYHLIVQVAINYAIIIIEQDVIENCNPKQATILGMKQAFQKLNPVPKVCLIDYEQPKFTSFNGVTDSIVKGDQKALCIAAASILAKVTRDQIMIDYHQNYPLYRFDIHKGYYTKLHQRLLSENGVSLIHRRTYAPIKKLLCESS